MPEWGGGRTTLETIVQELQRPVNLDETFERRVMVRVRRLHAERRSRGWVATGKPNSDGNPAVISRQLLPPSSLR